MCNKQVNIWFVAYRLVHTDEPYINLHLYHDFAVFPLIFGVNFHKKYSYTKAELIKVQ